MDNKHSVFFILHLPPPVHGAAMVGQYIHDSRVINESFCCRYVNLAMAGNIKNIGRFSFSKITSLFRLLRTIRKEMKANRPDIVYVTPNASGGAFYKDFVVVQAIKYWGGNVVLHFHNKGVEKNRKKIINNILYKQFFKKSKVILLSELLYPDICNYVKSSDVFFCPNGIPASGVRNQVDRQIPRVLFLSNLIVSKGVLQLLDACQLLAEKNLEFECDFVGAETDEMSSDLFSQEVKNRGLEGRVHYLGKKYGEEKESIWDDADIFVFPTFYPNECFPLVLLEAMQHGLPCVSTEEGAISGIIEDGITGFIVEKKNHEQLANRIEQLLSDANLRHSMGVAGRQKFEEEYTLSVFEKRMSDIFLQIFSERK